MSEETLPDQATDAVGDKLGRKMRALQGAKVPGPSTNPATNLIIADVGMRAAASLLRGAAEKGLLRARFDRGQARDIVDGKTAAHTLASYFIAKTATRSIPGFLLVSAGLAAKVLLDRGLARGEAEARGEKQLDDVAQNARD